MKQEEIEYTFKPIDGSLSVVATDKGWDAKYLTEDENSENPETDDALFLVAFHRQFDVRRDKVITLEQCRMLGYAKKDLDEYDREFIVEFKKKYHIFYLEAYIHSGVVLALRSEGNFPDRRWDVSQVGCVFVSKEEWADVKKSREVALSLIKEWNYHLSGEVYGCVIEHYDKDKNLIDYDSCWRYVGYDNALEELKNFGG